MPTRASSIFLFFVAIPLFLVLLADVYINPAFVKNDMYGLGKALRVYFMVYVLLPFALLWYYLGLVPGLLSVPAIFGLQLLWMGVMMITKPDSSRARVASSVASYFIAFMLVPFIVAWSVFGLSAGAAVTLALLGLSALYNAILYTSPRRK